jgi:protein-S-isoprenylcysteine O-methyltransferase Ste14
VSVLISVGCYTLSQTVRTVGMWHCGEHFSHIIMDEKRQEHELVTTGIYRYWASTYITLRVTPAVTT